MELKINVTLDATPALSNCLAVLAQAIEGLRSQQPAAAVLPPVDNTAALAPNADTHEATTAPSATASAEAEEQPAPQAATPTEADVREAMERTNRRIRGEDYKDNADSEGNKKFKKKLIAYFKNTAVALGADKPSLLPADSRAAFIEQCDAAVANEKGEIEIPIPF